MKYDIVIAGCGISGLLLGSELASRCKLLLLERKRTVPRNKYWLTNNRSAENSPDLQGCIDRTYSYLDFVAYDNTKVRVHGKYHLWNTDRLIDHLTNKIEAAKTQILSNHTFHSYHYGKGNIVIHTNEKEISAKLLIDCMGYGSPIITAKDVVRIIGYFLMCGRSFRATGNIDPIGLHNLMIQDKPTYFEAFPTSEGLVHTAMIVPARRASSLKELGRDFNYVVRKTQYASMLEEVKDSPRNFFGIIPVGEVNKYSLNRLFFYGEAGQINPATSATGLTRMLYTYEETARFLLDRVRTEKLDKRSLNPSHIPYMSKTNRFFQEALFRKLLKFNSDDFRGLVEEMGRYNDSLVNDMIFADFRLGMSHVSSIAMQTFLEPRGILGRCVLESILKLGKLL